MPRELAWKCPSRYSANWAVLWRRPRQIKRICPVRRVIDRLFALETMAKSDSFFIRAQVKTNAGTFAQTEIDLGSFVNLGVSKSTLLRIHNVAAQYADDTKVEALIYSIVVPGAKVAWQLTTQSKSALIMADDKSLVASGALTCYGDSTSTAHPQAQIETADINPQHWRNGYLIGVDSMFLGCDDDGTMASGETFVNVVLECTLETATQASSTALALSQQ